MHGLVCPCLCFVLVVSCFQGKFFVKDPSLSWLIQGKRGLVCTRVGKPECSRGRTSGYRAGTEAMLAMVLQTISSAPYPACFPAPQHRQLGSSERQPQTFSNPAKAGPRPPREAPAMGRGHRPSLSGLPRSVGGRAGLRGA